MKKKRCESCDKPRYCSKCGSLLAVTKKVHTEYDSNTGEKVDYHYHYWRCPNVNGILGFFSNHAHYSDEPDPQY